MIEHDPSDWLAVPDSLAICPECGADLIVDIYEWGEEDRKVTRGGFHISCIAEDFEDENTRHRHWQGEWVDVESAIFEWLCRAVRIEWMYP